MAVEQSQLRVKLEEANRKFLGSKDELLELQREIVKHKAIADNNIKEMIEKETLVETCQSRSQFMEDELSKFKSRLSALHDNYEQAQAQISALKVK